MNKLNILAAALLLQLQQAGAQTGSKQQPDWLINNKGYKAVAAVQGKEITLSNGLLSRSFRVSPNVICTDFRNLTSGEQLLRAVKPEAQLVIDGKEVNIGGAYTQRQQAYLLPMWLDGLQAGPTDMQYQRYEIADLKPYLADNGHTKAATGKSLIFTYAAAANSGLKGLQVKVHYDLFDGIPLVAKWLEISNGTGKAIHLDQVKNEILAMPEEESAVVGSVSQMANPHGIYVESNYSFNNAMKANLSDQTTHWKADSTYTSQVNYDLLTPCVLEVYPNVPVGIVLGDDSRFESIRTYELLMDGYDRERNGLAKRAMYRTIAPWTNRNPIFMHLVSTEPAKVKAVIDQCAATGYEGVILSFGSGLNMEDTSVANISKFKSLADYAKSKGILLGGYSLFSSRRISEEDDVINPTTGKTGGAFFGNAPCLGSKWGLSYIAKLQYFFAATGFGIFENDGPYPGDVCASSTHPGHTGKDDSQWKQMQLQKELYHWMYARNIYVNAPDWYFLDGTNKIALGYREVNFSLPRAEQQILNRQNIYDGLWEKTGSMSWGFVPLTEYQGGGAAATLEPLKDHLSDYEKLMMQYYGAGVQACYRGPRLYDTDSTRQLVANVVSWYKKYRTILNADILHLRRPDGRDWDGILHISAALPQKGLAMLYNPTAAPITREIALPLYYSGLTQTARIREKEGPLKTYTLDREFNAHVKVTIPAGGYTWLVVE
ncbi:MAG: alpha-galactosidase [Chitinophaga sp.]|uniref:alpha-galactosidase n=1 Tax=Chitinophaga sp. TaxID=1869181 RepID=UPI0025C2B604|nr:alpha-galactosidase [Chitinophaga sp.]MBV8254041.1 alpha-galactosidase [Chitinophaga sp.]